MAKTYFAAGNSSVHKPNKKKSELFLIESKIPIWIPILMFILAVTILISLTIINYDSGVIL
jgi:hypothetical protein